MLILNAVYHPALAVRFRTGSLVTRLEPPTCQDSASDGASFRAACFGPASNSALGGPASDSTVITGPEPASNSKVNRSPPDSADCTALVCQAPSAGGHQRNLNVVRPTFGNALTSAPKGKGIAHRFG